MPTSQPLMLASRRAGRIQPAPGVKPVAAPSLPLPCLVPALASGGLLWMCYHPLSWGPLAWLALVPLLCLIRSDRRPRNIYCAAWAGGCLFFLAALQWMRVADTWMYAAWILLAIYCALYFPMAIFLTRVLERQTGLPLVLTFSTVWVALEYVRTFLLTGLGITL